MSANPINLDRPTRLHLGGTAIYFALSIKRISQNIWPLIIIYFFDRDDRILLLWIALGVIIALSLAHAILEYVNFTFQIAGNDLTVRSGYIHKKQVSIPLGRIQSLNMKQNLLQQLLRVYTLEINTAGAKSAEITLHALNLTTIREVERLVSLGSATSTTGNAEEASPEVEPENTIVRLSPMDLLRVGLTNNHVKVIVIVYGFLFGIYDGLPERWQQTVANSMEQLSLQASDQLTIYLTVGMLCAILFSMVGAITASFAWYFNLKLSHTTSRLVLDAGLIAHKRILIPFRKIQTLSWTTNPFRRLLGIYAVSVGQASSMEETEKLKANVPGCTAPQVEQIQHALFGTSLMAEPESPHRSHHIYLRNLWLMAGLLPATIATAVGYLTHTTPLMWGGMWAIAYIPFAYLSWRHRYFYLDRQHMVASNGAFGHQRIMFALHKIQGVSVRQSIWQRPRGRATATLYLAGETIELPQIDAATAYALRDYALYLAENEQVSWM